MTSGADVPWVVGVVGVVFAALPKAEFARAMSIAFLVFKGVQFGAVWQVGLMEPRLVLFSVGVAAVGLLGFRVGLWAQDRIPQAAFNRVTLAFLGVLSLVMLGRAL